MDKCTLEISENSTRHKAVDVTSGRSLISRRLRFDELALRDRAVWALADDAVSIRAVVAEVRRELVWEDTSRFAQWAVAQYGAGLARAVGLVNGRPRLTVSA